MDVGPEGRVELLNKNIDLLDQRKIVEEATGNATGHMLQELRGLLHLLFDSFINLSIVYSIFHLVGLHSTGDVNLQGKVDNKFIAPTGFLWQNPVVGKETYVI